MPNFLPYIDNANQPPEILSLAQPEHRLLDDAERQQDVVGRTVAGKNILGHAHNNDHGKEVRQVGDRLNRTLERAVAYFVQQDRQQDRGYRAENQVDQAHGKGVADGKNEVLLAEEELKVLHPDPFAAQKTQLRLIFLKRDDPAPHRRVVEEKDVQQHRDGHDHQLILPAQRSEKSLLFLWRDRTRIDHFCGHGRCLLSKSQGERQVPPLEEKQLIIRRSPV